MSAHGGTKLTTLTAVAPGVTSNMIWHNANAEVYSLLARPVVAPGLTASAEITTMSFVVHGNPQQRELHYAVKNTGTTTANIEVWAFWWDA